MSISKNVNGNKNVKVRDLQFCPLNFFDSGVDNAAKKKTFVLKHRKFHHLLVFLRWCMGMN